MDLSKNTTPYGLMNEDERAALDAHIANGGPFLVWRCREVWVRYETKAAFHGEVSVVYRTAPTPIAGWAIFVGGSLEYATLLYAARAEAERMMTGHFGTVPGARIVKLVEVAE